MPFSRIFRSRRAALIWAAGVLWTAYDVASSQPKHVARAAHAGAAPVTAEDAQTDATGQTVSNADLAALANMM